MQNFQTAAVNAPNAPLVGTTARHVAQYSSYSNKAKRARLEQPNVMTDAQYTNILVTEQRVNLFGLFDLKYFAKLFLF
jgi:hypothetical protein